MNEPFKLEISLEDLRKKKLFVGLPQYGGQCFSSFARGLSDLTSLCRHYGIEVMVHFLSNESLIPRARNYIMDEFDRSPCTHMIFVDSDIGFNANDIIGMLAMMSDDSPYDVLGAGYPKKSYHAKTQIYTEDGWKSIHDLVTSKYNGKVASLGKNGNFEYKQVISHSRSPANGKQWVSLRAANQKAVTVTHDHEIAVIDDLFNPTEITWMEADKCDGKYVARLPRVGEGTSNENSLYNEEQLKFLVGTLLGDGSIDDKGYLKFGHSLAQEDYLSLKAELFGGKISKTRKTGEYKGKEYFGKFLHCPRNAQIDELRSLFYVNDKRSVKNMLAMADARSLAFWYMDDGCLRYNGMNPSIEMCTEGFSVEDNEAIVEWMREKFDIETHVKMQSRGKDKVSVPRIMIPVASHEKFFTLIEQYVIPSMKHKVPEKYHTKFDYEFNFRRLDVGAKKVTVEHLGRLDSDQYDIGVADNFNMIAEHYVCHNCISFEKIKMAVDKGFADEDPNELRKFVGDYVFNPLPTTKEFPINSPVEMLEIGTGFMMLRRQTIDRFKEAYPHFWYRPDHVRTEHFDGSRMVMAYFDCIIDRGFGWEDVMPLLQDLANKSEDLDSLATRAQALAKVKETASHRYLSEDYTFCQWVRKAGMRVWLAPWIQLDHTGTYVFGGSLSDLARLGASPTADPSQLGKKK